MTRVKQEETVMDLKIPVDIMDLAVNQPQQQGAPVTVPTSSSSSVKRERESSSSPEAKAGNGEEQGAAGALRKKAKGLEQQETSVSTDEAAKDASKQGIYNNKRKHVVYMKSLTHTKENKVIPMNKDNYFYCRRCIINIKGCKEYYDHLRTEHNIKPNISRVRHVDLQPDIDDANFFCRSCERPHVDRHLYYTHLKRVHHMLLQPFKKPIDPSVQPDIFNANHHCTVCKKEFVNKTGFKRHLILVHKIDREALEGL